MSNDPFALSPHGALLHTCPDLTEAVRELSAVLRSTNQPGRLMEVGRTKPLSETHGEVATTPKGPGLSQVGGEVEPSAEAAPPAPNFDRGYDLSAAALLRQSWSNCGYLQAPYVDNSIANLMAEVRRQEREACALRIAAMVPCEEIPHVHHATRDAAILRCLDEK